MSAAEVSQACPECGAPGRRTLLDGSMPLGDVHYACTAQACWAQWGYCVARSAGKPALRYHHMSAQVQQLLSIPRAPDVFLGSNDEGDVALCPGGCGRTAPSDEHECRECLLELVPKLAEKRAMIAQLEQAVNARETRIAQLVFALHAALGTWCPHDPGGDGADGETYRLVVDALKAIG